jgi:hypothetical protein
MKEVPYYYEVLDHAIVAAIEARDEVDRRNKNLSFATKKNTQTITICA